MNNIIAEKIKKDTFHMMLIQENMQQRCIGIVETQNMYAENTIFQGSHHGDGIKNIMEQKKA